MSENKKYTIVVKRSRVEVSETVYHAYHKEREAERYQKKLIHQYELSLERLVEERLLIHELFFNGKSERILASETGISNMTIHDRKCRILKKLKKLIEN